MDLQRYLQQDEVLTTGELAARLVESGYTPGNARQVICRAPARDGLWRSRSLQLRGGERIVARQDQVGTPEFRRRVESLIRERRPGIARVLSAFFISDTLLRAEVMKLLSAPLVRSNSRFPTCQQEIQALGELGLVLDGEGTAWERVVERSIAGTDQSKAAGLKRYARQGMQVQLTRIVVDHYRRQGVFSWTGTQLPDPGVGFVDFNSYPFSAVGFCWLKPLQRVGKDSRLKPTPVVCDVYPDECIPRNVASFVERIARAGPNRGKGLAILGIVAAPSFENSAWNSAKKAGLLTVNLRQVFGDAALEAMARVEELLRGIAGNPDFVTPEDLDDLSHAIEELRTNPLFAELRAISFETLVALTMRSDGWEGIRISVPVSYGGQMREVDVYGERNGGETVKLVECKAAYHGKELDPDDVGKFYTETVPAALKTPSRSSRISKCHAEMWTTGDVGEGAMKRLATLSLKRCVKPALRGRGKVDSLIPDHLSRCRRLVKVIAGDI